MAKEIQIKRKHINKLVPTGKFNDRQLGIIGCGITKPKQLLNVFISISDYQKLMNARDKKTLILNNEQKNKPFNYYSKDYRIVRYEALKKSNGRCQCCGARGNSKTIDGRNVVLHVDHIKPVSLYPDLAYSIDNLQILCEDCNIGKLNIDETDWRETKESD